MLKVQGRAVWASGLVQAVFDPVPHQTPLLSPLRFPTPVSTLALPAPLPLSVLSSLPLPAPLPSSRLPWPHLCPCASCTYRSLGEAEGEGATASRIETGTGITATAVAATQVCTRAHGVAGIC